MLPRSWIVQHIPHQGRMCLLDAVLDWNQTSILCRAVNQADDDHPLRAFGRLGSACGIEYAAQAMAVHGALLAPQQGDAKHGYLVSVRSVNLHVARLDDLAGEIRGDAEKLSGDDDTVLYRFALTHRGRPLVDGRAAIVLGARRPGSA